MFRERSIGELIHWSGGHGNTLDWYPKISDITPGSLVGVKTDEGDLVKVKVTKIDAGSFTGSIVDIQPEPPQSERLADLEVGDEVTFGERNLRFVFSVPKQPSG